MGEQYHIDIIAALAERTIKRLWVIVILLVVLLFGSNAAWIWYESQYETISVEQEVRQMADNGENSFVGGDYYGAPGNQDEG